jgi:hypothetical protein
VQPAFFRSSRRVLANHARIPVEFGSLVGDGPVPSGDWARRPLAGARLHAALSGAFRSPGGGLDLYLTAERTID